MSVCSPSKRPPHKPLPVEIPALDTENSPACLGGGRGSSSDYGTRLPSTPILPSWAAQALHRDSPGKGTWSLSHETESPPHPHDLSHVTTSLCVTSHPLRGHRLALSW